MRKTKLVMLFLAVSAICSWNTARSMNIATQQVTFEIQAINEIMINNTLSITDVKTVSQGSDTTKVIKAVSTYSITTNEENKKITGVLNTVLPKDASLKISLEAPTGAKSNHNVLLTETPSDLVTGVTKTAESGKKIFYRFSAPDNFQLETPLPQIITLTITD